VRPCHPHETQATPVVGPTQRRTRERHRLLLVAARRARAR
jgi:hypothetical protein